nr:hypothetical protein [uncultured Flavobacterium sp.]
MNAPERLNIITDYIIENHKRKTHNKEFTAMFCVSGVPTLIDYYNLFYQKRLEGKHDLKIATIFSFQANEDDKEAQGYIEAEDDDLLQVAEPRLEYKSEHTRDTLENYIKHYNKEFGTNFTSNDSQSFYNYYNDIAKRVKSKQIDVLLVVNMFLTGFDSKHLNTLYVDKNLQYHGLIQAYSRTNRILNEMKSQGNIVCFRNLKHATDQAIALFSNINAKEDIIIAPYEDYVQKFNEAFIELLKITPTVDSVNNLRSEEEEFDFVKAFRELMRIKNVLNTFTEFDFSNLSMTEQQFEDYKSKYLDLHDKTKVHQQKELVSILDDIDFELELIHRDEINVSYILKLLAKLKDAPVEEQEKQKQKIVDALVGETQLRSKRELIEQFINNNLPLVEDADTIPEAFEQYWLVEQKKAIDKLVIEENLKSQELERVIGDYIFTEKKPMRDDVIGMLNERPSLKERATTSERIIGKIYDFVETFISGIGN